MGQHQTRHGMGGAGAGVSELRPVRDLLTRRLPLPDCWPRSPLGGPVRLAKERDAGRPRSARGLFIAFAGRMTDLGTATDGTGRSRIQLWSDALQLVRKAPVFGIGMNQFGVRTGFSGPQLVRQLLRRIRSARRPCFWGPFFFRLRHAGPHAVVPNDVHPCEAAVAVAAVPDGRPGRLLRGLAFLDTRTFVVPTYLVLGLFTAYQNAATAPLPQLAGQCAWSGPWCWPARPSWRCRISLFACYAVIAQGEPSRVSGRGDMNSKRHSSAMWSSTGQACSCPWRPRSSRRPFSSSGSATFAMACGR